MKRTLIAASSLAVLLALTGCTTGFGNYVDNLTTGEHSAETLKIQGDVRSSVSTIQSFLVSNPKLMDVSTVPGASSSNSDYSIKASGSWQDWKVVGQDKSGSYAYVYSSKTGSYTTVQ